MKEQLSRGYRSRMRPEEIIHALNAGEDQPFEFRQQGEDCLILFYSGSVYALKIHLPQGNQTMIHLSHRSGNVIEDAALDQFAKQTLRAMPLVAAHNKDDNGGFKKVAWTMLIPRILIVAIVVVLLLYRIIDIYF